MHRKEAIPAAWNCGMPLAESHSARLFLGISGEKTTGKGNCFLYSVMQNTLWGGGVRRGGGEGEEGGGGER